MKKARNKFRQSKSPTKSQIKRDELASNMLNLQQLILHRIAGLIERAELLQDTGIPETRGE